MPTGPSTKLRTEDQLRGHRLDLGGAFGDGLPGTIVLHESAPGAADAQFEVQGPVNLGSNLIVGGSGVAGSVVIDESVLGAGDGSFSLKGDATIWGDLDVHGDVSFETLIINFKDRNLTLNYDGSDLTADGGGLTIDRVTLPKPSLIWKNSLNAWAAGIVGTEKEITTQGNAFNNASQLVQLDGDKKIPLYSTKTYVHDQLVSSATWSVVHNMNKRPSVTVITSAGDVVFGDAKYVDDNNMTLTFAAAFGGKAYCN